MSSRYNPYYPACPPFYSPYPSYGSFGGCYQPKPHYSYGPYPPKSSCGCHGDKKSNLVNYDKKSNLVVVDKNIEHCTTWTADKVWLISAEVHVTKGNTLQIKKGTKVLFKECPLADLCGGTLPYASLVVDSGASICAEDVEFSSQKGGVNNTGGLIICGTLADGQFETYSTVKSYVNCTPGSSYLKCCSWNNLGNNAADINALTYFNLKGTEMTSSNFSIKFAGDDGWEIFGGDHSIENLTIWNSIDDCLDLDSNATLNVTSSLTLINRVNGQPDVGQVGPGLVEVIGVTPSTNTLNVAENANVYMQGRITDKTTGLTTFGGLFSAAVAGQGGEWSGLAPVGTFISGII